MLLQIILLFLNQNICYGYSKEPSQCDGSFEHPKLMIKQINMKVNFKNKKFAYLEL